MLLYRQHESQSDRIFEKINGKRQKQGYWSDRAFNVHDNVGLCKGTSEHPLCEKEGEAKVER